MDQQKLRSLVFEKTGIKIDSSDPVFALVVINEALLEEAVQRHLGLLEQTSKAMIAQMQAGAARHGVHLKSAAADDDIWETSLSAEPAPPAAPQIGAGAPATASSEPAPAPSAEPKATQPHPKPAEIDWRVVGITALLSALLVLLGQTIFFARPGLSSAQEAQLRQADKLQKILPKLDAKTRSQIEAELQKSN